MKARELLAACFLLCGALPVWPLLTIASHPVHIGGVPALDAHGGKLTAAAKHTDMDPKNFSDKMARYGLGRQAAEPGEGGPRPT